MTETEKPRRKRDSSPTRPNAAAINIGATLHVAAVGPDQDPEPVRSFGPSTDDLHRLADGFGQCGVRTVAVESTGAFETLDQRGFEVILVNARDAKHVPGRKTDISDAQWLQRLHEYGLLRASVRLKGEVAGLVRRPSKCADSAVIALRCLSRRAQQLFVANCLIARIQRQCRIAVNRENRRVSVDHCT